MYHNSKLPTPPKLVFKQLVHFKKNMYIIYNLLCLKVIYSNNGKITIP